MRAVLGIDAAWTTTQPSGVALAVETVSGWHLAGVASSYQRFHALGDRTLAAELRPLGAAPDAAALLRSCAAQCGRAVDLVAIDMPLSHAPITGRRPSDNLVSSAWGRQKCATHSPSAQRPGPISDELSASFTRIGYPLRTISIATPGIIEVYPHPALVILADAAERLPYKAAKAGRYWPGCSPAERKRRLQSQWAVIVALLDQKIAGVAAGMPPLPDGASGIERKAFEDMLDAIVCAWVAICVLDGHAVPLGDAQSAIWIPLRQPNRTDGGDPWRTGCSIGQ